MKFSRALLVSFVTTSILLSTPLESGRGGVYALSHVPVPTGYPISTGHFVTDKNKLGQVASKPDHLVAKRNHESDNYDWKAFTNTQPPFAKRDGGHDVNSEAVDSGYHWDRDGQRSPFVNLGLGRPGPPEEDKHDRLAAKHKRRLQRRRDDSNDDDHYGKQEKGLPGDDYLKTEPGANPNPLFKRDLPRDIQGLIKRGIPNKVVPRNDLYDGYPRHNSHPLPSKRDLERRSNDASDNWVRRSGDYTNPPKPGIGGGMHVKKRSPMPVTNDETGMWDKKPDSKPDGTHDGLDNSGEVSESYPDVPYYNHYGESLPKSKLPISLGGYLKDMSQVTEAIYDSSGFEIYNPQGPYRYDYAWDHDPNRPIEPPPSTDVLAQSLEKQYPGFGQFTVEQQRRLESATGAEADKLYHKYLSTNQPGGPVHGTSTKDGETVNNVAPKDMITVTSKVATPDSRTKKGFLGICSCPRGAGDGMIGSKGDTCTFRFLQAAKATAACQYTTADDVECVEKNGRGTKELTDGDTAWWMQQFCKRCVDAGGQSDPDFPCPASSTQSGKTQAPAEDKDKPITSRSLFLPPRSKDRQAAGSGGHGDGLV